MQIHRHEISTELNIYGRSWLKVLEQWIPTLLLDIHLLEDFSSTNNGAHLTI